MSDDEVKMRLRRGLIAALELKINVADVPDVGIVNALGIDSLQSLEYLMWVEGEFGVQIEDEDLNINMVDKLDVLADYLQRRRASTGTGQ